MVANPFNLRQQRLVSLRPEDIDVIVFWTRNATPLIRRLKVLDDRKYNYYFQYTITGYPRELELGTPKPPKATENLRRLSEQVGKKKVIWRYDPIIIANGLDAAWHRDNFSRLLEQVWDCCHSIVISLVDDYRGVRNRMRREVAPDFEVSRNWLSLPGFEEMLTDMVTQAKERGLVIKTCAEALDLSGFGIEHGKCIDAEYIWEVFGVKVDGTKDKNQRKECGCAVSCDIGFFDTCVYGCRYCYATRSDGAAKANIRKHDVHSPLMIGWPREEHTDASTDTTGQQLGLFDSEEANGCSENSPPSHS